MSEGRNNEAASNYMMISERALKDAASGKDTLPLQYELETKKLRTEGEGKGKVIEVDFNKNRVQNSEEFEEEQYEPHGFWEKLKQKGENILDYLGLGDLSESLEEDNEADDHQKDRVVEHKGKVIKVDFTPRDK